LLITQSRPAAAVLNSRPHKERPRRDLMELLRIDGRSEDRLAASLPFSLDDATAGSESELQAAVKGSKEDVDLYRIIKSSDFYQNLQLQTSSGEQSNMVISALEDHLENNDTRVWENSWVHFPFKALTPYARQMWERDLLANKKKPQGPQRCDAGRFIRHEQGEKILRVPVSYLLKLSLADAISRMSDQPLVMTCGMRYMEHFLSDNTSPETFSFFPVPVASGFGMGRGIAEETALRFLFCQFLTLYANRRFDLESRGQSAMVYFAPHPPVRQKSLNGLISDNFYRELFMSPCLSGWDRGEAKHAYMHRCHKVLSRSQLNALGKLKDAGIITRNLVVLPNTSNVSLANNGTHVSLGSLKLSKLRGDPKSGFDAASEKRIGDLVIKIFEHFAPLFVGTYTAAPFRLDWWDFHPEKALGFLPHELNFTHLRMIWRRWKKKADLNILGRPVTPFGPVWLDRLISKICRVRGDFVQDFRLIDYFACLGSTPQSPALDGTRNNDVRLRQNLESMGVFDASMAMYLLYRLREYDEIKYSGFEGRYYSLFEDLLTDMGQAVNLQVLVTALAYKYIVTGRCGHRDIPDNTDVESERRQIFFGSAIGIPTFFVRQHTRNRFLSKLIAGVRHTRSSRRYKGYVRVRNDEYCRVLVQVLRKDASDLIEILGMQETLADLENRVEHRENHAVAERLTRRITDSASARSPLSLSGAEFNRASEQYYRQELRLRHIEQAFEVLRVNLAALDSWKSWREGTYNKELLKILGGANGVDFVTENKKRVMDGTIGLKHLTRLIGLTLLVLHQKGVKARRFMEEKS